MFGLGFEMRSYYDKEWHCDCEPEKHTIDNYIKGLHNIFDGQFHKAKISVDDKFIHVITGEECILATSIFQIEYHGLVLSSIHSSKRNKPFNSEITLLFDKPTKNDKGDT